MPEVDFSKPVPFEGVRFEFRDEVLLIPALPLKIVRVQEAKVMSAKAPDEATPEEKAKASADRIDAMAETIRLAIERNYPERTKAGIDEIMDDFVTYSNLNTLYSAAIGLDSDAKDKPLGPRMRYPGGGKPVEKLAQSTGASSTGG